MVDDQESIDIVVGNTIYKISMYCPHRWGRLQYGRINLRKKTITCPLHSSLFSLETGKQLSGPPCGDISIFKISNENTLL